MNDPRITAYALGELTGKERDNFERDLAGSDALQSELNNIVSMANELGGLPKPSEGLTTEDRIALLRACHENQAEFQRNKKSALKNPLRRERALGILPFFLEYAECRNKTQKNLPHPEAQIRGGGGQ
jgi:anti-sigma factor RsiW